MASPKKLTLGKCTDRPRASAPPQILGFDLMLRLFSREMSMSSQANVGGTFRLPGTSLTINRMGYGAMQLPGPHVWGPPRDKQAALAVLREAAALGINHIDTADFYGPG